MSESTKDGQLLTQLLDSLRQDPSRALTIEVKEDGQINYRIHLADESPASSEPKVELETRNGTLELSPDDPLAQAKLALDEASAGIEELMAVKL